MGFDMPQLLLFLNTDPDAANIGKLLGFAQMMSVPEALCRYTQCMKMVLLGVVASKNMMGGGVVHLQYHCRSAELLEDRKHIEYICC